MLSFPCAASGYDHMHARQSLYSVPASSGSVYTAHPLHLSPPRLANSTPVEDPASAGVYAPHAVHDQALRSRELAAAPVGYLAAHDVPLSRPDAMLPRDVAAGGRMHSAPANVASPDLLWRDLMQRPLPGMAPEYQEVAAVGPGQQPPLGLNAFGGMGVRAAQAAAEEAGISMHAADRMPRFSTHERHERRHSEALAAKDDQYLQQFPGSAAAPRQGGAPTPSRAARADYNGQHMHAHHVDPGRGPGVWDAGMTKPARHDQTHIGGPYPFARSEHVSLQPSRHDHGWEGERSWTGATYDTLGTMHGQHALAADAPLPETKRRSAGGPAAGPAAATSSSGGGPPYRMPYGVSRGGPAAYDSTFSDRYMAASAADFSHRQFSGGLSPSRSLQDLARMGPSAAAEAAGRHSAFYTSPSFDYVATDADAGVAGGGPRAHGHGGGGQPAAGAPWSTDRSHGFATSEAIYLNPQVSIGSRDNDGPESQGIGSAECSMHGSEAVTGAAGQQRSVDRLIQLDHLNRCGTLSP